MGKNQNRKPTSKRMTEQLRKMIKSDVENGKTQEEVRAWYGVCKNNVSYAVRSNSMAEYRALQRSQQSSNRKSKEKKLEQTAEKDKQTVDHVSIAKDVDKIKVLLMTLLDVNNNIYDLLKEYMEV